jgi:hypothetical protein
MCWNIKKSIYSLYDTGSLLEYTDWLSSVVKSRSIRKVVAAKFDVPTAPVFRCLAGLKTSVPLTKEHPGRPVSGK